MPCRPLRVGDIVTTSKHKGLLLYFEGRNGCNRAMCFGQVVKNGKPQQHTCRIFFESEVTGIFEDAAVQLLLQDE